MGKKTVDVASIGGNLNVSDGGAMLTRVVSGTRVSFRNGGGQTPTKKALPSDTHIMLWMIVATAAAAITIGAIAASQGKSPF
jgi:hypothetical protein